MSEYSKGWWAGVITMTIVSIIQEIIKYYTGAN